MMSRNFSKGEKYVNIPREVGRMKVCIKHWQTQQDHEFNKYGLCTWATKISIRILINICDSLYISKNGSFYSIYKNKSCYQCSNFFFKEIVRLHGLPRSIISPQDTTFVGHFWRTLWKKLGNTLSFISTYHPQTHGSNKSSQ